MRKEKKKKSFYALTYCMHICTNVYREVLRTLIFGGFVIINTSNEEWEAEVRRNFEDADKDKDGHLDRLEFVTAAKDNVSLQR